MKRFLIAFIISILIFPIICFAENDNYDEYNTYLQSFDLSCFDELDNDTKDFLEDLNVNGFNYENISDLSLKSVFNSIINITVDKSKSPLKSAIIVLCFIILSSLFNSMSNHLTSDEMSSLLSTITSLVISVFLVSGLSNCILLCCSTIKICSKFSFAFFSIFCVIVATSGGTVTSLSVNTMLLILSQGLGYLAEVLFLPLTNCFLALGICSSIRQELNIYSLVNTFKKIITALISLTSSVFVAILSFKTAVSSKADALGLRSARFAINTVVPLIGGTISEGLLSIQSYSSLVKSSVGVVGIIAIVGVFLPALIEVNLWRLVLSFSKICADVFDNKNGSLSIQAFSDTLLIIDVVLILSMVTTIISIGILVAVKTVV